MRKIVSALLTAAVVASMFASATFAGNAYGAGGNTSKDPGCNGSWTHNGCKGGKP